jgi:hypothetical protein
MLTSTPRYVAKPEAVLAHGMTPPEEGFTFSSEIGNRPSTITLK